MAWTWDETLYAGAAGHYVRGRAPYPPELAAAIAAATGLDGGRRLLDIGCGPGSLTLLLARYVGVAIGVDPDAGMLAVAAEQAARRGLRNVGWRRLRAEDLPDDLGEVDLVCLAQSFHWMERARVAKAVRVMLADGGALIHVHAETSRGSAVPGRPVPPWSEVDALVAHHLGPGRRAGRGVRATGPGGDEDAVYTGAGFVHDRRFEVAGIEFTRDAEQVLDSVHSMSWAAPHLFGDRLGAFDAELRALLGGGVFTEQLPPIAVDVYR